MEVAFSRLELLLNHDSFFLTHVAGKKTVELKT